MSAIEFRQLRPEDNDASRALILDILNREYAMALSLQELPDLIDIHRTYVDSGDGSFWVACVDGRIAACIGILQLTGADYELRRMYVDPAQRGNGIAQRLLDVALAWSITRGVGCIYLETHSEWKTAHHIYEKNGFEPVDRECLPSAFPVVRIATAFYRRCLR